MTENAKQSSRDEKSNREVPLKLNLGFAVGEITDMVAYQGFTFLIFTFYSVVIGINVSIVTLVYIIWSIYNAFNDPVLGALSDRTKTKRLGGGRRRPWIIGSTLPLAIVMVLLFTSPRGNDIIAAVYMCFIMCLFDTFYTAWSLNHTSLYPEMFPTNKAREEAGRGRRIFMVFGLLIAFILPGLFVGEYIGDPDVTIKQYQTAGLVLGLVILVTATIHVKTGIREPSLEKLISNQAIQPLSFKDSIKITLKNKTFLIFIVTSCCNWYVFGILPLLMPLYVAGALGESNADFTTYLLLIAFLSSIGGVVLFSKIDAKVGSKKGILISMIWWACSFIPLYFIEDYAIAAIMMIFIGMGLGGPTYFIDRNISNIIDEDEFKTKQRREASYYGVHAIFIRLASILVILSVNVVFAYNGWSEIDVGSITEAQKSGLRLLMSIFPAVAMLIGMFFLKFYRLGKKEVDEIQQKKKELNK
jgi:GPH family glycoside/pentoside/hexuronide:cation symporter